MSTVEIYEPPVGCGVGSCGPEGEEELERFNSALKLLEERGVTVSRYNLGHEPEAFARNPVVKAAVKEHGIAVLPLVFGNDEVVCERRYPSSVELTEHLGKLPRP
jgi:hypothetical protein